MSGIFVAQKLDLKQNISGFGVLFLPEIFPILVGTWLIPLQILETEGTVHQWLVVAPPIHSIVGEQWKQTKGPKKNDAYPNNPFMYGIYSYLYSP